jgi:UDP-N-acetylglucosamine 2-epimerase (non-hydrolysing)
MTAPTPESFVRVAIVLGTRPEIIKLAPVIRECRRRGWHSRVVHTGQHYSPEMDRVFFDTLDLPAPDHTLEVGSGPHGRQTAKMLSGLEPILQHERPDVVLVQGDTNSVLAGGLAAAKLNIPIGHIEAGLRSGDRSMPEEQNRIVVDHLSDYLFPPTAGAADRLRREGLSDRTVVVTGNTVVDAVRQNLALADRKSTILNELGLLPGGYLFLTAHRQENVDHRERFAGLLDGVRRAAERFGVPVVYPIHPRSRGKLAEFSLDATPIRLIGPVDFLDSLHLQWHARLILTDSGGVQEEACVLGVPCVTLRDNTERPETVEVGANELAGADPSRILAAAERREAAPRSWVQPFGDGRAAVHILDALAPRERT